MVIVPIIPDYLRLIGAWETHQVPLNIHDHNSGPPPVQQRHEIVNFFSNSTGNYSITYVNTTRKLHFRGIMIEYEGEDSGIGVLFASKAAIQIFINPISGTIIDKVGYDLPMMFGLTIMFFSTLLFACGSSYGVLFFARSLQGVGSAFADTGGLSMIADRYTEESERSKALGIALAFISFGCLVAPPFGGVLYEFCGKAVPFIILAFICLIDGLLLLLIMRPMKAKQMEEGYVRPKGTPIWKLFMDPHIACCSGALIMANVSLAFLEPTISKWMTETMDAEEWQQGMIWLPAFFPHVIGVIITVKMTGKFPEWIWALAAIGLALEGLSCFIIPFSTNYFVLMIPISIISFGIALIDTSLLPTLGFIVDKKYESVYGSVYAIADISYCAAYAIGPVIAGHVVEKMGFTALNIIVAILRKKNITSENWAYEWWLDDMYLNVSSSLPINSNPGWVFPRLIFKKGESLEMNTLEIEMSTSRRNKQPLCMKQYYRLLNFYRKPGIVKDEHIDFYSSQVKDEEIIVVMIKSHIYKIKVKVIGEWISLQNIYSHFWSVYNDSRYRKELNMDEKVQLLTTCNRRKWGSYYANMICNEKNASNFKDISRSLLIICFDETETLIGESKNENNIFRQILCGDGPFSNGCNRWFDKTLQLIINPNGINGICFEHSPMEGVAVLKTLQNVLYTINQSNEVFENKLVVIDCPMEWQLNDDIKNGIIDAKNNFVKLNADIDIEIYQFTKYGKDYIKSLNFSPDTFIQMTLQLTYYRLNGTLCSSYESGSTRRFLNGRVDCIRSSHLEALYWVERKLNHLGFDGTLLFEL
ncbi:SLC18A3 [Lepeophtheirus salmonis]|uniref:SLC18A3 n=1 Tax=Lepeophtheirus salmonis TaxID=72036 RepID=A0A7R8H205_LEPSM|nr:SLC18A3 [Lepeophtheirus salmonis]CAF2819041.1 SLC18A3 [Lepeophtheirus salmonis]